MSFDISELFKGVAVVIDDEVNDKNANIQKVLNQVLLLNIPTMKYVDIPSEEVVSHFQNLSFVLLDWRLIKKDISTADLTVGVTVPSGLEAENITQNINFIKKLNAICYCPIFIFTNEHMGDIENKLVSENVYMLDRPSNILIRTKSSLKRKDSLKRALQRWIKSNPSVYILKEWEREYQQCKNSLFLEFQEMSPVWPRIMWKCFDEDGGNKSLELGELISRNLHTRMKPFEFREELMKCTRPKVTRTELRKVLEGSLFLKKETLHDSEIAPGDLFYMQSKYYLNIRAGCDLIPDRHVAGSVIDDVELYLLTGSKLSDKKTKRQFSKEYGHFKESDVHSIIFPLHDGNAIDFRFKQMSIKKWNEVKDHRIGRILPPFITKIQQRCALYLHRDALPRIPNEAI